MRMGRRGPGLVGMAARTAVVAGTATAVSGRVPGASRTSTPSRTRSTCSRWPRRRWRRRAGRARVHGRAREAVSAPRCRESSRRRSSRRRRSRSSVSDAQSAEAWRTVCARARRSPFPSSPTARRHPCPTDTCGATSCRFRTSRRSGSTTYDAKDPATSFPPIEPLRPPEGAPNVLDRPARRRRLRRVERVRRPDARRRPPSGSPRNGLKYNRFHTTALCSPTRQALLTGRNHHSVGMGGITEIATSAPGYNSIRPNTCAPLAETLKLNGYSTAQFGKCHEVPVWETSPMGPFNAWPTGSAASSTSTASSAARRTSTRRRSTDDTVPIEPDRTRRGGLPLHRGHDRPGDRLGPAAEGADAGQAVLRLLRARRDPRAAPRPAGVVGQVQGPVRRRLGRAARADVRAPEGARRRSRRMRS